MPNDRATSGPPGRPPEPWASFLVALDNKIDQNVDLHCIGGFVVTVQFGSSRATSDIDILAAVPHEKLADLQRIAGERSILHRKFKVYLQPVTIATYPEDYESRLVRMWPDIPFKYLRLYSLEPHDLALTKLERNSDVDRQDIRDLAEAGLINPTTLRQRYEAEVRPNLVSRIEKHNLTLTLWVEMCWPPRN